jgi:hypothetical protein
MKNARNIDFQSVRPAEFHSAETIAADMAGIWLALKARFHISLGHRPRIPTALGRALKARFKAWGSRRIPTDRRPIESRFQRCHLASLKSWGVAPGWYDLAPLALDTPALPERTGQSAMFRFAALD